MTRLSRPAHVPVTLHDGATYRLRDLLSRATHKQAKGRDYRSVGLILVPHRSAGAGVNLCRHASPGCVAACFAHSDRLAWPTSKRKALARTLLLARRPDVFREMLASELRRALANADRARIPLCCRLNVVSDLDWVRHFPELFAGPLGRVIHYAYTKDLRRALDPARPANMHYTFSRSEMNEPQCLRALAGGVNVAVVFRRPPFPSTWWGHAVIDGDAHDLRFTDPSPVVVGLRAKGPLGRRDASGFVVDVDGPCRPSPAGEGPTHA